MITCRGTVVGKGNKRKRSSPICARETNRIVISVCFVNNFWVVNIFRALDEDMVCNVIIFEAEKPFFCTQKSNFLGLDGFLNFHQTVNGIRFFFWNFSLFFSFFFAKFLIFFVFSQISDFFSLFSNFFSESAPRSPVFWSVPRRIPWKLGRIIGAPKIVCFFSLKFSIFVSVFSENNRENEPPQTPQKTYENFHFICTKNWKICRATRKTRKSAAESLEIPSSAKKANCLGENERAECIEKVSKVRYIQKSDLSKIVFQKNDIFWFFGNNNFA